MGNKRKGRGPGADYGKPAMVHVNLRLPEETVEFFQQHEAYTAAMRDVLVNYVNRKLK